MSLTAGEDFGDVKLRGTSRIRCGGWFHLKREGKFICCLDTIKLKALK